MQEEDAPEDERGEWEMKRESMLLGGLALILVSVTAVLMVIFWKSAKQEYVRQEALRCAIKDIEQNCKTGHERGRAVILLREIWPDLITEEVVRQIMQDSPIPESALRVQEDFEANMKRHQR